VSERRARASGDRGGTPPSPLCARKKRGFGLVRGRAPASGLGDPFQTRPGRQRARSERGADALDVAPLSLPHRKRPPLSVHHSPQVLRRRGQDEPRRDVVDDVLGRGRHDVMVGRTTTRRGGGGGGTERASTRVRVFPKPLLFTTTRWVDDEGGRVSQRVARGSFVCLRLSAAAAAPFFFTARRHRHRHHRSPLQQPPPTSPGSKCPARIAASR